MVDLLAYKGVPVFFGFFLLQKTQQTPKQNQEKNKPQTLKKILHRKSHFCVNYRFELHPLACCRSQSWHTDYGMQAV